MPHYHPPRLWECLKESLGSEQTQQPFLQKSLQSWTKHSLILRNYHCEVRQNSMHKKYIAQRCTKKQKHTHTHTQSCTSLQLTQQKYFAEPLSATLGLHPPPLLHVT